MIALSPEAARTRLHEGTEIAFLDLREAGQFGEGHPLFAIPVPYSRLELSVGALIPRLGAPVVLIDGGDGVSQRAARRLEAMGFGDVSFIEGGIPAWVRAGFPIYKGVNVPSKTLGELAEVLWHPRMIQAPELAKRQARGESIAFFDTRPPAEYAKMRVPGAQCLPNGELAHRLDAVAADRPIVLTCAGRTRGIVGAIGMALVGAGDRVVALENGTQGWALAGYDLERDNTPAPFPELGAAELDASRARARSVMQRYAIPAASADDLRGFLEDPKRTTYLFDVRSEAEATVDPIPAAVHALGGQLAQATDQWVAVRHSRIVLCCDTGLRSAIAGFWLRQLGYEPFVVPIDDALRVLPPRHAALTESRDAADLIAADTALDRVRAGAYLVDLRGSQEYRARHVAGAIWGIRPQLSDVAARVGDREAILVGESHDQARLAALDLREAGLGRISIVEGGQPALESSGAVLESTPLSPDDEASIDFLFFVHDRHDGNLEASRRYLEWETGLVDQMDALDRQEFRLLAPAN